ncbi:galactokinase [Sphaerisporangium sp. B11E5]|uniref:galactokinase n=1 Tax=Sphaerisporangium sp. B11E5 TaxID=3153563 RepID=UPI00325D03DB
MRVAEAFQAAYGRPADVVWHAPGRVNLIGEHTDYNDGFVLPYALPWGVTAAVSPRDDATVRLFSLQSPGDPTTVTAYPESTGWTRYVVGVLWALREAGHQIPGADIAVDGDVPQGAGLSSSAALEVAVASALNDLYSLGLSPLDLALVSQKAENDFVGMPCGIMDQAASALSKEGHALFLDCRTLGTRPVPLDLASAGLELLIVDTGVHHELADGQYARRRQDCENAARHLGLKSLRDVTDLAAALSELTGDERKRTQHVVTENHRVEAVVGLLRASASQEIGALLNASHISLRDQYEVSCAELDVAVEAAVRGGARGARMTGGGFGGSAIALVPADRLDSVRTEITGAYTRNSWAPPRFLQAPPSAGARRVS